MSITKQHISNNISSELSYRNAISLISFITDGKLFNISDDNLTITEAINKWMKYNDLIYNNPKFRFRIEYSHPYKSKGLSNVIDYDIYDKNTNKFIIGYRNNSNMESAKIDAFIKIIHMSTFEDICENILKEFPYLHNYIFNKRDQIYHSNSYKNPYKCINFEYIITNLMNDKINYRSYLIEKMLNYDK